LHDLGCAGVIQDLGSYIRDVCDSVALMQDLDLIISCESALAHIASLAGKECWLPYSWLGKDYRIGLDGKDQLWTQHRIFRQGKDRRWEPVFEEIAAVLRERIG